MPGGSNAVRWRCRGGLSGLSYGGSRGRDGAIIRLIKAPCGLMYYYESLVNLLGATSHGHVQLIVVVWFPNTRLIYLMEG